MYTYSFNIYDSHSSNIFITVILKAENRFSVYKSIFIKPLGDNQEEWETSVEALNKKGARYGAIFFDWLRGQRGTVPYMPINSYYFTPYEFYKAVKRSDLYNITVETNEPVEDFGDPGTYFDDMYDPNVVY